MKNKDFAIFIMVWGRPNKMWTAKTFRDAGYTGKIYYIADDLDETVDDYKLKYGEDLIVYSKEKVKNNYDLGDNSGDLRSTMFSANMVFKFAREKNCKYFMLVCDDYTNVSYKFNTALEYQQRNILNLDKVLDALLEFYKKIPAVTIAMAQNGDFIGGGNGGFGAEFKLRRKAMNSFICSVDRPFEFMGRLNEDVTTYVNLGSKGQLFLTVPNVAINQLRHQSEKKGLTEMYLDYGTYVKSFMSVMYNPSCIVVSEMGDKHKRVHHKVKWNYAVPKIISEGT